LLGFGHPALDLKLQRREAEDCLEAVGEISRVQMDFGRQHFQVKGALRVRAELG